MSHEDLKQPGEFKANIKKIEGLSSLHVSDFINFTPGTTPGNVGVCLSGGGSRAMTAGMGQLRGLKELKLLENTKAISTVSGGSWVGVPFAYLDCPNCSDDDYLGIYIKPSVLTPDDLDNLPGTTIGFRCTKHFSLVDLLVGAFILSLKGVPANMLWQTLIGKHIMAYYQLFETDKSHQPNSLFSFDSTILQQDVIAPNPSLVDEKSYLIASGTTRTRRPYLICNMGMCVFTEGIDFKYLVPVQATPFFTGVVSTPPNVKDCNGKPVGGGTVTSFAFSSDLIDVASPGTVTFSQSRQFAVEDAVGVSSAAFAETIENLAAEYIKKPAEFIKVLMHKGKDVNERLKPGIQEMAGEQDLFESLLDKLEDFRDSKGISKVENEMENILDICQIHSKLNIKDILKIARLITLIVGIGMILFAYLVPILGGAVNAYLTIIAIMDMPLFVIAVIYGLLWKRVNWQGAVAGYIAGAISGIVGQFIYGLNFNLTTFI
ncbi:MAG: patatin-like phospholipase family protein, partial [Acidobacteria bacterium]|nr:patatin-like phospholipase family protein [Acidobacteriota bacterium]